ncbi:MAG: radical SAM protein [Clostridia bacterium]|nr:radical SAM protein [Clostridia bacterium]
MRHVNIPIFIPHMGCPNMCVFCNQRSISGKVNFDISRVENEIEQALSTAKDDDFIEIAFFGGSFTGIDRNLMCELLSLAQKFIDGGRASSIRLSTRPDYIDGEILDILSKFSVGTIELGLQSMDDGVLQKTKRGHTSECAERACKMIKERGFSLIGQMMIGLPDSTVQKEIYTAQRICEMGADGARIYPTVVFYQTELCDMMQSGVYTPLSNEEAVERTKEALKIFVENDVPCIRVGLQSSENLSDEAYVAGGANHSAIGEMAMSALYLDKICAELDKIDKEKMPQNIDILCARGEISKIVGQKRKNIEKICQKYAIKRVKVLEKSELLSYNIIIDF